MKRLCLEFKVCWNQSQPIFPNVCREMHGRSGRALAPALKFVGEPDDDNEENLNPTCTDSWFLGVCPLSVAGNRGHGSPLTSSGPACNNAELSHYDPIHDRTGRAIKSQGTRRSNQAMVAPTKNNRVQAEVIVAATALHLNMTTTRSRPTEEAIAAGGLG